MNTVLVWKEQLQNLYAKHSVYIEIGLKLVLGLLVFGLINSNVGFMESVSGPVVTVGLAVVCAFLPLTIMCIAATALLLLHFYTLSIAAVIVAGVVFLLLYIFLLRFSYNKAWLVLITAVAFTLKVPFIVPVAVGLLATPIAMIPVVCGTIAYYLIDYIKLSSSTFAVEGVNEIMEVALTCAKQIASDKEMWIMVAAVGIGVLLVYGIRTRFFDHAWKIASVVGAVADVVICTVGSVVLNCDFSLVTLIVSGVLAVVAGLLLEIAFFAVDYSRTEQLEFEDDEYHYYVKAIPKYAVTAPEKKVKQIAKPENKESFDKSQDAEEILLTRSLSKELGLNSSHRE